MTFRQSSQIIRFEAAVLVGAALCREAAGRVLYIQRARFGGFEKMFGNAGVA